VITHRDVIFNHQLVNRGWTEAGGAFGGLSTPAWPRATWPPL